MYKRHASTILALCFVGAIILAVCFQHTQPAPPLFVVPCVVGPTKWFSTVNIAFSPDGRQMATVTVEPNNQTTYRLEPDGTHRSFAGKLIEPFIAKLGLRSGDRFATRMSLAQAPNIAQAQFSADGKTIAAAVAFAGDALFGRGGQIVLWNTQTGHRIGSVPYKAASAHGVFDLSKDGSLLAVYGREATIYAVPSLKRLVEFNPGVKAVSGSMDVAGRRICLLTRIDNRAVVRICDLKTGKLVYRTDIADVDRAEMLPDGDHVLLVGSDRHSSVDPISVARVWSLKSNTVVALHAPAIAQWFDVAADGSRIAFSSERFGRPREHTGAEGHVAVFDVATGRLAFTRAIPGVAQYAKLSANGKLLAFTVYAKNAPPRIEVVDVATGKKVRDVPYRAGTDSEFAPDANSLAVPIAGNVEFYGPFKQ